MQKVLVSAGAVGAAALELNNNQATEVVEAAPHGVQQRRRSQSKKEEPAALIKRGHTTAKAHHGNSVARVQNGATVFWIVFGVIGILGLALGLGLGLGLPAAVSCPNVGGSSYNTQKTKKTCACTAAPAAGQTPVQVNCVINTKADYDAFETAECTEIVAGNQAGDLVLDGIVRQPEATAVKELKFNTLIEVEGKVQAYRAGAKTFTEEIYFKKLAKIAGNDGLNVGGDQGALANGEKFHTLKAGCLQEAGEIKVYNVENLKDFDLSKLVKTTNGAFLVDRVGTAGNHEFSFSRVEEIATDLDIRNENPAGNKNKWRFTKKDLKILGSLDIYVVNTAAGNCPDEAVEVTFNNARNVAIGGAQFFNTGPGAAFLKFSGQDKVNAYSNDPAIPAVATGGFQSLNPSVKTALNGPTDTTAAQVQPAGGVKYCTVPAPR